MDRRGGLGKYLNRGFIFLMSCLACSMFVFWFTEGHSTESFLRLMEFGIPAWFGLNAVERWAIDRPRVIQNGNNTQ